MAIKTVITPADLDNSTVIVNGSNKVAAAIQGVSADAGNVLINGTDGKPALTSAIIKAHETVTTISYDAPTKALTYINEAGTVAVVDLSALAIDMNVSNVVDNNNGTYSFVVDDGGPTVVLDLSTMLKMVATANSPTVTLTGNGTSGNPLTEVNLSTFPNNQIMVFGGGLYVPPQIETTFAATSSDGSVVFTPAGTAGHEPNVTVDVAVILPTELVSLGGVHLGQIGL